MNWSGRLSIGRYFPSNDINDEALWLFKGGIALHYHLHNNFTMLPFIRFNYSNGDVLTDSMWVDYGTEFILMPNAPWNFSLVLLVLVDTMLLRKVWNSTFPPKETSNNTQNLYS